MQQTYVYSQWSALPDRSGELQLSIPSLATAPRSKADYYLQIAIERTA